MWRIVTVLALVSVGALAFWGARTDAGHVVLARVLIHTPPAPHHFPIPSLSAWKARGRRYVAGAGAINLDDPALWNQRHGDGRDSDEVMRVGAPTFKPAIIIAPHELFFSAVTMDRDANLYATPYLVTDHTMMVSYSSRTGATRWRIKTAGDTPVGGVPIVLRDPKRGGDTVYVMSREEAVAVRPDGTILWRRPTGLPALGGNDLRNTIMWGPGYNPVLDALMGVTGDGQLIAMDRETGRLLTPKPLQLPGAPSPMRAASLSPALATKMTRAYQKILGRPIRMEQVARIFQVVLGEGVKVANFQAIDPVSGRMWISATAPDGTDGKVDGVSHFGALYGVDLARDAAGQVTLKIACHAQFHGGSATTPGLRADGNRVYAADADGELIAYDKSCRQVWALDVGGQIVGSPSVASDNGEVYVVTGAKLVKIVDEGKRGRIVWSADFDMFDAPYPFVQQNLLTAAITPNGIYALAGVGMMTHSADGRAHFAPIRTGAVRLDRETGKVLWFAQSKGDSVANTEVAPDGSIVVPQSPIRSVVASLYLPGLTDKITGGIAVFHPMDERLLARDALCIARQRVASAIASFAHRVPAEAQSYLDQARALAAQARDAAVGAELSSNLKAEISAATLALDTANDNAALSAVGSQLRAACAQLNT